MTKTSTDIAFGFDILTEAGDLVAEDIQFTATLEGNFCRAEPDVGASSMHEDVEFSDVRIEVTQAIKLHGASFFGGKMALIPLPAELKPAFDRWAALKDTQERCQEWLEDANYMESVG